MAQVSHNYENGPLSTRQARLLSEQIVSGGRLPDVEGLECDGRTVRTLDLLGSGAHTLLILSGQGNGLNLADETAARFARRDSTVRIITITPGTDRNRPGVVADPQLHAHRRNRARQGRLLLVRPDGHVACSAPLGRTDVVEKYLERLTTGGTRTASSNEVDLRIPAIAGATDANMTAGQAVRAHIALTDAPLDVAPSPVSRAELLEPASALGAGESEARSEN
jgi:hypothetical protein